MAKGNRRKKISCFVALPHHTRFMHPVLEEMNKQPGIEVEYFTTASDFPFEKALVEQGKNCKILQNYIDDEVRDKIAKTKDEFYRKWNKDQFGWDGMRQWPLVIQTVMINDGITEYYLLEKYIEHESPDLFVALHERNRWGKLIGHLARKNNIPYVSFQEGDYYEDRISFSGHTEYSTALLLWGRDTAQRLTRLQSAAEKMVLTGNTHLDAVAKSASVEQVKKDLQIPANKPVLLFMVGLQWGVIQKLEFWRNFLQGLGEDVVKVFKWHPKVNYRNFQEKILPMFQQHFPDAVVVQNYDPYDLIKASDYCLTLGKTTLAVEALCFDKPVFSVAGTDGAEDHYLGLGISQALNGEGNWQPLYETINQGVPPQIQKRVKEFMSNYFYENNRNAIRRSSQVIEYVLQCRELDRRKNPFLSEKGEKRKPGKYSFILASGYEARELQMTVLSLAEKVSFADWELIVVLQNVELRQALDAVSGDIRYIECPGVNIAQSYNRGVQVASGEFLFFLQAGAIYCSDLQINMDKDSLYCFPAYSAEDARLIRNGQYFDFNGVPRDNREMRRPTHVAKGMLACHGKTLYQLGGFDELIADVFAEADISLLAEENQIRVITVDTPYYVLESQVANSAYEGPWRERIRFFAKWQGRYAKSEDYLKYAEALLNG